VIDRAISIGNLGVLAMKQTWTVVGVAVALTVLAVGIMVGGDKPAAPVERQDDVDGLRKAIEGFSAAFQKGDAAAAAGYLTSGAELIPGDVEPLRGRDAIQKAFVEHFAKNPRVKITIEYDTVRFTSRDSAMQEGTLKVTADKGESSSRHFSMLCVREDGKWLLAFVKEWPDEQEDLKDLDWLIGSWTAKQGDAEIQSKYEWFGNKSFIKAQFTIRAKDKTITGMQMIGTDPKTGDLRTWIFEADGGFGSGTVEREGKKWIFESTTALADGSTLEAKNILVQVNKDTFTWQSIDLTVDGEQFGNLAPVKVTRVNSKN
jgi:uncharacterized protein (TIGR02246 family)